MDEFQPGEDPNEIGAVGYGRPPVHSRFQKGRSGNPRGRPRARRSLECIVGEVLDQKMWVTVDGRRKRVPVEKAILLRLRELALKGDLRAARMLLDLTRGEGETIEPGLVGDLLSQEDLAILAGAGLLGKPKEDDDEPA